MISQKTRYPCTYCPKVYHFSANTFQSHFSEKPSNGTGNFIFYCKKPASIGKVLFTLLYGAKWADLLGMFLERLWGFGADQEFSLAVVRAASSPFSTRVSDRIQLRNRVLIAKLCLLCSPGMLEER